MAKTLGEALLADGAYVDWQGHYWTRSGNGWASLAPVAAVLDDLTKSGGAVPTGFGSHRKLHLHTA